MHFALVRANVGIFAEFVAASLPANGHAAGGVAEIIKAAERAAAHRCELGLTRALRAVGDDVRDR